MAKTVAERLDAMDQQIFNLQSELEFGHATGRERVNKVGKLAELFLRFDALRKQAGV